MLPLWVCRVEGGVRASRNEGDVRTSRVEGGRAYGVVFNHNPSMVFAPSFWKCLGDYVRLGRIMIKGRVDSVDG
jgi:hypothetical protein